MRNWTLHKEAFLKLTLRKRNNVLVSLLESLMNYFINSKWKQPDL